MDNITRREFLDRSKKGVVGLAAGMSTLAGAAVSHAAGEAHKRRPTVMCVYYPHWHSYDHGNAWKGEGWTEWEGVKTAISRFPGHHQPLKPTWGYFDESDPKWTAREIDLAADHGIDVFLYDWYWYSGVQNMQEALEQGFLRAENRDRMKFALMWANHDRKDQFCPDFDKERTLWLPSRHSPRDLEWVIDYCMEHYFCQSNYWQVDGGLYLSIYQATRFVEELGGPAQTRKLLEKIDGRLSKANLPPMHWSGMVSRPEDATTVEQAGFRSTSKYNVLAANKVRPDLTVSYEDVMEAHREHWQKMNKASLVNLPVVTVGWDATPRCRPDIPWPFPISEWSGRHAYPYCHVVVGNTHERFEQLLQDAAEHVKQDPRKPFAVLLNAWNEWTEGCYLLPEDRTGTARLKAVKRTFGLAKQGEK
jgi:glycosyl transferase family WbsX